MTASWGKDEWSERATEAAELLEKIVDNRGLLAMLEPELRERLQISAGRVARPENVEKKALTKAYRRRNRKKRQQADQEALEQSGIRVKRSEAVFQTPLALTPGEPETTHTPSPQPQQLHKARSCYVCKERYDQLHSFYDALCPTCAELNWSKRHQTCDLSGRVALVTGARVKIGYQAAIMLLRAGARVLVTTRFPHDAAQRYAREPDFPLWSQRLQIFGLDLRYTPAVEAFTQHLNQNFERLDFIINNACQTVRRPAGFYQHLLEKECLPPTSLSTPEQQLLSSYRSMKDKALPASSTGNKLAQLQPDDFSTHESAMLSQLVLLDEDRERSPLTFPEGALDADLQQIDMRRYNSWRMTLDEVPSAELFEVQLVNAIAPFIINARLKRLMCQIPSADKHIVNVSAVEGQFSRRSKTEKHPHTNMAKAALNMMTRTSASDYVKSGIHMNSVDTGWVTDEDPIDLAMHKKENLGFHPPLDIVDGAARICDPIFHGFISGTHTWGKFLKDYVPTDW